MMPRPLDVDQIADTLVAVAAEVRCHLSPEIARRIDAIRTEIAAAVTAPKPGHRPAKPRRDVEQWV